ncbi:MAG: penicillin-binding protein 1C [bacterium]
MKRLVRALAIAASVAAAVVAACAAWIALPIPAGVMARANAQGLTIVDRHGVPLRSTRSADGSHEQWIAYERIDPDLINAFVAVEDHRFWDHHGVDARAIARATRDNLNASKVTSGASTITMQLARLLHSSPRRWDGKLSQAMWALRLEAHLSKQQILEQYLNRVQLGQATVGVGAASALYFNASASELSLGQAATLAGIAHAPSRENPYTSPKRAGARRAFALRRMRRLGYASREDVDRIRDESLRTPSLTPPFLAPHFTSRVLSWVSEENATSGEVQILRRAALAPFDFAQGRRDDIVSSLDLGLQTAIESEVRHTVDMLRDRGVEHAAAVVLDNETGEVLAWVGSPNFWAQEDGQTDMVVSARQPGSALKPFLYGMALDRGFTAASVLPDLPKAFATATGAYSPRNYDRTFRGPVRAREALASSYNVPAVHLAARLGAGSLLQTLRLAGFESLQRDAEYYGLGLALGNGDVTLIELANGYRALASAGEWRPWTWQLTSRGSASGAGASRGRRVISPMASAILLNMLSDADARIPGFGLSTPFDFPFPVAVKTGTSRHFTDNWAVATTRGFTVAVWAGNFNGRPMQGVSGITGAGPLLHRAVMETAKRVAPGHFTTPSEAGAVAQPVCRLSGLRATSECAQLTEWFAPGTAPAATDDWEHGGSITLPAEYAEWARQRSLPTADGVTLAAAVQESREVIMPAPVDTLSTGVAASHHAHFQITSPRDGDRYAIPAGVETKYATISLRTNRAGRATVKWSVDGKAYTNGRWPLAEGTHVFRAMSERGENAEVRVFVGR